MTHATRWVVASLAVGGIATASGCVHSYQPPVVTSIQTGVNQESDVAWIVEDNHTIIRCTGGQDRPLCRRADVE